MIRRWWDKELEDFIPEEKAAKAALSALCNMQEEDRQKCLCYLSRGTSDVVNVARVMEIVNDCLPFHLAVIKRMEEKQSKASLPIQVAAHSGFAVTLARRTEGG